MDIQSLEDKVAAATEKVEKCKGTIERHEKQLEKKVAIAEKLGCNVRGLSKDQRDEYIKVNRSSLSNQQVWAIIDIDSKLDDIKGATRKLADAEQTLRGWEDKLAKAIEVERTIAANCPPVIQQFLEQWKVNCTEYYQNKFWKWPEFTTALRNEEHTARAKCLETVADVGAAQFVADTNLEQELWKRSSIYAPEVSDDVKAARLQKFTEEYTKDWERYCEKKDDYYLRNVFPHQLMDAYLKSRGLDHQGIAARRREFGGELLLRMLDQGGESDAFAYLENALEAEKKAKIIDLVNRIEKVIGRIVDGDNLHIGLKGDLEGIIAGEKGKAKINTIGAGGYNIQCFHFRTLIHEIKEKDLQSVLDNAQERANAYSTCEERHKENDFEM